MDEPNPFFQPTAPTDLTPPVRKPRRALETHALPLDAFLAENPALDLQHVERVILRSWLPTTGSVHFDNLELRR
jgi:hypothetical protein